MSGAPRRASGDGRCRGHREPLGSPGKVEAETAFYPQERPFLPTGSPLWSPVIRLPQSGGGSRTGYWYT